jgi:type IV pilus assembly protein PilN
MKLTLNLASRSSINRRALYAFYTAVIGILVLMLALNLGYYTRLQTHNRQIKVHLTKLERDFGQMQEAARGKISPGELELLQGKIAFANKILIKDSFRWTALLDHLEEVVTEDITIRAIQPDYKDGSLKLTGLARGVSELRVFLDALFSSPHFSDVFLLSQSRSEIKDNLGRDREALSFSILLKGAF